MKSILVPPALVLLGGVAALADVRLPNILSDHMVVQRDQPLRVWGWAAAGERITVEMAGKSAATSADAAGGWEVKLPAMQAGGPFELTVRGHNTVKVTDVLAGEVWLCSGQSNMEFELKHANNAQQEIQQANHQQLRLLLVPRTAAGLPLNDVRAKWFVCAPDNPAVADFSAVGYFFGREIQESLKVPVGMIGASQGATQIELWTPPEGVAAVPSLAPSLDGIKAAADAARKKLGENLENLSAALPAARAALAAGKPLPPEVAAGAPLPAEGGPVLYYGMIHPLERYAIRGALWYQGESNCGDGMRYLDKMKALIGGWRQRWQLGDFPFYYVQITPNNYNGALPLLLEAQNAAQSIPNTGMAAATDTCDASDHYGGGHPRNKQVIGHRLALWALAKDYGRKDLVYCGPRFHSLAVEGGQLRVRFDFIGGGLVTRDNQPPDNFEIAGADGKFHDAVAQIDGATVVVRCEQVPQPVELRHAWKDLAQPNLMNKEGLPVAVFRAKVGGE
jgi:sialate O-acetylesterase